MTESYLTLMGRGQGEITVQKSRFLGYASPCISEEDALRFLQEIRAEHRGAKHHCYAYIIGENSGIIRYNDNGEPAGTAGMPILDVLKARSLVCCCTVIVRYFGGILLGTGGLVRAYSQCAVKAVEAAGIARMEWTNRFLCEAPYACWDRIRYTAENLPVQIRDVGYGSAVSFSLLVRETDRVLSINALMDASGRSMEIIPEEKGFLPWQTTV